MTTITSDAAASTTDNRTSVKPAASAKKKAAPKASTAPAVETDVDTSPATESSPAIPSLVISPNRLRLMAAVREHALAQGHPGWDEIAKWDNETLYNATPRSRTPSGAIKMLLATADVLADLSSTTGDKVAASSNEVSLETDETPIADPWED